MKQIKLVALSPMEAEIYLYGEIGIDITAQDFARVLAEASTYYPTLCLCINSGGGDILNHGLAMVAAIDNCRATINTRVDGIAASMASVIFAKGKGRTMAKYAKLMIHQSSADLSGSADKLRETATTMDQINADMAAVYAAATGKEAAWILESWMKPGVNTWFTSTQALAEGLATEIIDGYVTETQEREPAKIAAHFNEVLQTKINKQMIKLSMFIPGLNQVPDIKLAADADDATISAAISQALGKTVQLATALKDAQAEVATLKANENTIKMTALADKATALVDGVVGTKITAEQKSFYLKMASRSEEDYALVKAQLDGINPVQDPMALIKSGAGGKQVNPEGKELITLSFKELHKSHPKFLAQLKKDNPALWEEKKKAQFGE